MSNTIGVHKDQNYDAKEAYEWLLPPLKKTLADLYQVPPNLAAAVLRLQPFGYRAVLEDLKLVKVVDDGRGRRYELQPLTFEVMKLASAESLADPEGVNNLVSSIDQDAAN